MLYVPLLVFLQQPLSLFTLYTLFFETLTSPVAPYLRLLTVCCLVISLGTQFLFCLTTLLSETGTEMIEMFTMQWRQILASLGFMGLLFVCNDLQRVLVVVYMNRPGVKWWPWE
jgi:hypothetical protein